jgi:hypothetical protein
MSQQNEKIEKMIRVIREKFESRINEIKKRGTKKINQISDETPDPSGLEASLDVIFDVKWKTTSIKFDVPQFSMKLESIKFDIPEVKMKLESIKFDVPRTRMKMRCVAKNPIGGGCLLKTKIPEVYMHTLEIKTDIPQIHSKRVEVKLHLPEVRMETTEIKLDLPQFYLKRLSGELQNQERDVQEVSNEMTSEITKAEADLKIEIQKNLSTEIEALFSEMLEEIIKKREDIATKYDEAIAKTKSSIKTLKENNATAEVQKLESQLGKMVNEYIVILKDLDNAIEQINSQKRDTLLSLKIV